MSGNSLKSWNEEGRRLTSNYDDPAYDYQAYWHTRQYENQAEKIALQKLFGLIGCRETIADVGSGFGRLTSLYAPLFRKCLLIDPSLKLIQEAKKLTKKYNHLSFKRASAEKLPLKNNCLEVVIFIRTAHHVKDLRLVVEEFYRVLKPGGFLILEFANKAHIKSLLKACFSGKFNYLVSHRPVNLSGNKKVPFFNYHPAQIKTLLLAHDFKLVKVLSVSNFRHSIFKKLLPLGMLLWLEKNFSLLTSHFSLLTSFGPSIFVLAQKPSSA